MWRCRVARRYLYYFGARLSLAVCSATWELADVRTAGVSGSVASDATLGFIACVATAIGLAAAALGAQAPSGVLPYGGVRAEVIGGFVQGLLLLVAAFVLILGALCRSCAIDFETPHNLQICFRLVVFAGGVVAFRGGFDGGSLGRDASSLPRNQRPPQSLQGMFLHVVIDGFGGIIKVLSVWGHRHKLRGCFVLDLITSAAVATLVFVLVVPFLRSTAFVLMQRQPSELDQALRVAFAEVRRMPDVVGVQRPHAWCLTLRHEAEGSVRLLVDASACSSERCEELGCNVAAALHSGSRLRAVVQVERGRGGRDCGGAAAATLGRRTCV